VKQSSGGNAVARPRCCECGNILVARGLGSRGAGERDQFWVGNRDFGLQPLFWSSLLETGCSPDPRGM